MSTEWRLNVCVSLTMDPNHKKSDCCCILINKSLVRHLNLWLFCLQSSNDGNNLNVYLLLYLFLHVLAMEWRLQHHNNYEVFKLKHIFKYERHFVVKLINCEMFADRKATLINCRLVFDSSKVHPWSLRIFFHL